MEIFFKEITKQYDFERERERGNNNDLKDKIK